MRSKENNQYVLPLSIVAYSSLPFKKNCSSTKKTVFSDADGDSLFRKRLMLKENQYSKDCRTYESIINIYYIQHLERSPYKLIDKWIV